jgi:hypothetical protein
VAFPPEPARFDGWVGAASALSRATLSCPRPCAIVESAIAALAGGFERRRRFRAVSTLKAYGGLGSSAGCQALLSTWSLQSHQANNRCCMEACFAVWSQLGGVWARAPGATAMPSDAPVRALASVRNNVSPSCCASHTAAESPGCAWSWSNSAAVLC